MMGKGEERSEGEEEKGRYQLKITRRVIFKCNRSTPTHSLALQPLD
jgi:hypothetical protein